MMNFSKVNLFTCAIYMCSDINSSRRVSTKQSPCRSVRVAEWLALPTSVHGVAGSNPAGGEILPEPKWRFIAQSLSCSSFHRLEVTEILLKGRKTLTHPSIQSPCLKVFYKHHPLQVTLDSGAEINMIKSSIASRIGAGISKNNQSALQADGVTPLTIIGETHLVLSRNGHTFKLDALVVND